MPDKQIKRVGYLLIIGCIIAAAVCRSRAFIAGYSCSLVFLFLLGKPLRPKRVLLLLCCLLVWIGVLVVFTKSDSSAGRLLIYKIAFRVLDKNLPWGVGAGGFQKAYAGAQADYFRAGRYTTKELLLADNISTVYNDYLQLLIAWGVLGALVLIAGVGLLIRLQKKAPGTTLTIPFVLSWTQLIAVLVAACFTHVFGSLLFQGVALLSFLYLLWPRGWIILSLIVLVLLDYGDQLFYARSYRRMSEAAELLKAGYVQESLTTYAAVAPPIQNDPVFLNGYATALMVHRDYQQAIVVLNQLNARWPSSVSLERAGACYQQLGDFPNAESTLLTAIYTVPNRFTSRWSLFNLYLLTHQTAKAVWIGQTILSLPIKIPSPAVLRIKQDVAARMPAVE